MSIPRSRNASTGAGMLFGALVVIALFILVAPHYSTQVWWVLRQALFLLPFLIPVALFIAAVVSSDEGRPDLAWGFGLLCAGTTLVVGAWVFVGHTYAQDKSYVASVQVTREEAPEFAQRAPFTVATAQAQSALGEVPGDIESTMYVPGKDTFGTLVQRRGNLSGYQTLLEQRIPQTGPTPRCDFGPAADRRFDGFFSHSLGRLIHTQQRWVNWSEDDAYGICVDDDTPRDGGKPLVIIPLKQQDGWLVVVERAAGVAVYDGVTGELDIRSDARGLPGPSYPLSLAATQRESTTAVDGFGDWFFHRAGWELADEADSVNSSNANEFVLATADGRQERYVTPQTGRGSSTAISVLTVVDARLRAPGLAPMMVHRLDPVWRSPTAITDKVRADFGDVFSVQRDASIQELAPLDGDKWVVTIGTPQNMIYRVRGAGVSGDIPCLFNLTGQQLRCGPAVNQNGFGPGAAIGGQPNTPTVPPAPADSDLVTLSDEQFADLLNRVADETARRLGGGS